MSKGSGEERRKSRGELKKRRKRGGEQVWMEENCREDEEEMRTGQRGGEREERMGCRRNEERMKRRTW